MKKKPEKSSSAVVLNAGESNVLANSPANILELAKMAGYENNINVSPAERRIFAQLHHLN